MENANKVLSYIGNNYIRGQKEYWQCHYRQYVLYMTKGKKKRVSIFDNGNIVVHEGQRYTIKNVRYLQATKKHHLQILLV